MVRGDSSSSLRRRAMSLSSMGESVNSVVDNLVDDEFLTASPFHPKNVEARRPVHESPRTAFQPRFVRMDSMDYRGKGIIEDVSDTAPVSASPSRPSPVKPFPTANTETVRMPSAGARAGPASKNAALPPRPTRSTRASGAASPREESRRLSEFSLDARRPKGAPIPQPPTAATKTHRSRSPGHTTTPAVTTAAVHSSSSEVEVPLSSSSAASSVHESDRPPLRHASSAGAAPPARESSDGAPHRPSATRPPTRPRAGSSAAVLGVARCTAAAAAAPSAAPHDVHAAHGDTRHQHRLQRRRTVPAAKVDVLLSPTPPAVAASQRRSPVTVIAPLSPDAGPQLPLGDRSTPATAASDRGSTGCVDRAALHRGPSERQWMAQSCSSNGASSHGRQRVSGSTLPPSAPASVGELAGTSPGTVPTVSPMPSLDLRTTGSEGSGAASPRLFDGNGRRRSTRQLPPTSSDTRTSNGSDVPVASSPPKVSAETSRLSAASSSCSPTPLVTPSAALSLTAAASSAVSSPLPTINVPRLPRNGHGTLAVDAARSQATAATGPPPPPPSAPPTQLVGGRRVPAPVPVPVQGVPAAAAVPPASEPALPAEPEDQRLRRWRLNLTNQNEAFLRQAKASPGPRSLLDTSAPSFADSVRREYYNLPTQSENTVPHFARPTGDLHVRKVAFSHILAAAVRSPVKVAAGARPGVRAEPTAVPVPPCRPPVDSVPSSPTTPPSVPIRASVSLASYSLVWSSPQSDPRSPQTPARPCRGSAESSPRGEAVQDLASLEPLDQGDTMTFHSRQNR